MSNVTRSSMQRRRPIACTSCSTTPSIHGTHTAGIAVGDGSSGVIDANGFLRGLGVAPWAALIEQAATILMASALASLYPALRASRTPATELSRENL